MPDPTPDPISSESDAHSEAQTTARTWPQFDRRQAGGANYQAANAQALQALSAQALGVRWASGLIIASIVIAALYFGREILIPLALAILLGFLLDPAVTRLKRWGMPRMLATLLVVVLALGALGGTGFYMFRQVQQLSQDLPTYQSNIHGKLKRLQEYASGPSLWDGAIKTYDAVERGVRANLERHQQVQQVQIVQDAPKPGEVVMQWLGRVSEPIALTGIVLLFVILILLDRDGLRDRLLRLMGGNLHVATDALDEASERIGKYLRMQFTVNVTYGIPMAVGLWFIGVPGAVLWGVMATIMRFVPYVGPMISAIFPLLLAFAVAPGWEMLLWTLCLILVLELISNNVIEPWLYGASTGLSTLAIIMAATFWTSLWGPIGLILSTPLTVCLLVLGRYLPGLRFMEVLLGSQPVLDAPQRLYQRLLVEDVNTAVEMATSDIQQRMPSKPDAADQVQAVMGFYDQVAVPMLRLMTQHYTESATVEHRLRLSAGMEDVLQELREDYPPLTQASVPGTVMCVGLRWEVDALAADMLAHSLQLQGVQAHSAPQLLGSPVTAAALQVAQGAQWLLVSVFHAQPQPMLRQLLRRVQRQYPHMQVVLALWNVAPDQLTPEAAQQWGVQAVGNSVHELSLRMVQLLQPEKLHQGYVAAALPENEAQRVLELHRSGVLDPVHEPLYQETVLKAINAFNVRYAQVSWVDRDWVHAPASLLASHGEQGQGLPRDVSICSHVVFSEEQLVVEDVARDPRFASNPVLAQAQIQFYAGVPLLGRKGVVLGTLCLMHDEPHSMQPHEMQVLQDMAQDLSKRLRESHEPPPVAP